MQQTIVRLVQQVRLDVFLPAIHPLPPQEASWFSAEGQCLNKYLSALLS